MPIAMPAALRAVLLDKAYGHVITQGSNGAPQVTMVWMDVDGNQALFNTADGRVKVKNLRRDPRIQVSVQDRHHPQAYALLQGIATLSHEGAEAHIDAMAQRFLGLDTYPWRTPGERRILVRIDVEKIGGFTPQMQAWA